MMVLLDMSRTNVLIYYCYFAYLDHQPYWQLFDYFGFFYDVNVLNCP